MKDFDGYRIKLNDPRWKILRQKILTRDKNECKVCTSKINLNVHHRAYIFYKKYQVHLDPWKYPFNIYVTLCEKCHEIGHSKYKVPIKYI